MKKNTRRTGFLSLPLLVMLIVSGAVHAADPPILGQRISLDLKNAPAQQVLKSFAAILQADLVMDTEIDRLLEVLAFKNVTVRTGLDAACESLGCHWQLVLEPTRQLKIWARQGAGDSEVNQSIDLDEPISIDLIGAESEMVLRSMASILGAELDQDPSLAGRKVSIRLDETPARESLDTLCEMLSCHWQLLEGEPPILQVEQSGS